MTLINSIVISSGHSKHVRGACGVLDEVNEARKVVERLADELIDSGVEVITFHDDTSMTQDENLCTIVNFHNAQERDLDISVHFNAYVETTDPMGTECLYLSQSNLAAKISSAIASCGLIDRGPKERTDLFFLNGTDRPAILIEVCFVDSVADANVYRDCFKDICLAISRVLVDDELATPPAEPEAVLSLRGKCSWFGGPGDDGVAPDEGLAFIYEIEDAPHLFLPFQPEGTTGLARRLNPHIHYIACRWNYEETPRDVLLDQMALVQATEGGKLVGPALRAFPADWGPHQNTDRICDISPGLMSDLNIQTDSEVQVTFPAGGITRVA